MTIDSNIIVYIVIGYIGLMWIISSVVAILDKYLAINHKRRIPEKLMLFLGALGGALGEYVVMKMIHHKTRHKKFMIGLPVIAGIHFLIILVVEIIVHVSA